MKRARKRDDASPLNFLICKFYANSQFHVSGHHCDAGAL